MIYFLGSFKRKVAEMEINTNKIVEGIKSIYKKNGKESLSEKEIEELCNNSPFSMLLNNTFVVLGEEVFRSTFLKNDKDLIDSLYGVDRRRKYLCSIYAGQIHLVNEFEAHLAGKRGGKKIQEENIKRIGLLGFWHYFVECKSKHSAFLINFFSYFFRERVIDIIEQNRSPFCSMASSNSPR